MRRIRQGLKALAKEVSGDTSTLEDRSVLDDPCADMTTRDDGKLLALAQPGSRAYPVRSRAASKPIGARPGRSQQLPGKTC